MLAVGRVLLLVAVLGYVGISQARGGCFRCKRQTNKDPGLTAEESGSANIGAGVSGDADEDVGVSGDGGGLNLGGSATLGINGISIGGSGSIGSGLGKGSDSEESETEEPGSGSSGTGDSDPGEPSPAGSDQGDFDQGGSSPEGSDPGSENGEASDGDNGAGGGSLEGSGSVSVGAEGHNSGSENSGSKDSAVGDIGSSLGGLFGGLFGSGSGKSDSKDSDSGNSGSKDSGVGDIGSSLGGLLGGLLGPGSGKSGSTDFGSESSKGGSIIGDLIGSQTGSGSGSGPNFGSARGGSSESEGPVTFPDPNTNGLPSETNDDSQENDGDGSGNSGGFPDNGYNGGLVEGRGGNQGETDGIGQGGSQAGAQTGGQVGGDHGILISGSIDFGNSGSFDDNSKKGNGSGQADLDLSISNLGNVFKSKSLSEFLTWLENYIQSFDGSIDDAVNILFYYITKPQKTGYSILRSALEGIVRGKSLVVSNLFYGDGLMANILNADNKTLNCLIDSSQDLPEKVGKKLVNCPAGTVKKVMGILTAIVEDFHLLVTGVGTASNKVFHVCSNMSCRFGAVGNFGVSIGNVVLHIVLTLLKVVQLLATPATLPVCLVSGTITGVASELFRFGKTSLECFTSKHVL